MDDLPKTIHINSDPTRNMKDPNEIRECLLGMLSRAQFGAYMHMHNEMFLWNILSKVVPSWKMEGLAEIFNTMNVLCDKAWHDDQDFKSIQKDHLEKARTFMLQCMDSMEQRMKFPQLVLSVRDFNEKYPEFPLSTLGNWIRNRNENGFEMAMCKPTKKVYILEERFFEWLNKDKSKSTK